MNDDAKPRRIKRPGTMGTDNPRFKRYHMMVSAPELYDAEAVEKALAILRAEQATREDRQKPVEEPQRRADDLGESSPLR